MPNRLLSRVQRQWLISILLVAVVTRALIPAGFMPAAGFTYQICPDGFPARLLEEAAIAASDDMSLHDEHAAHRGHGAQAQSEHSGRDPQPQSEHSGHGAQAQSEHSGYRAQAHSEHSGAGSHAESQHHGHGSHEHAARAEHCVFAAAAGAGPAPHAHLLSAADRTEAAPHLYFSPTPPTLARYRVQQPRGPPQLS